MSQIASLSLHFSFFKPPEIFRTRIRVREVVCRMTFTAFSETWVQGYYLIANISWWPEPSTPDTINATMLKFIIELIEST